MAYVVISYSRTDSERVRLLRKMLESEGIRVWQDQNLEAGEFQIAIENEIHRADAVVIVWSQSARESRWVRAEADLAIDLGKAISVRIDDIQADSLPLLYKFENLIDLLYWNGNASDDRFRKVVNAINSFAELGDYGDAYDDDEDLDDIIDDPLFKRAAQIALARTNFTIIRPLATGEVSTVYLGRLSRRKVTVKVLRNTILALGTESGAVARNHVWREIELTSQLRDPCFLRVVDAFYGEGDYFVVTDYAPGRTIAEVIEDRAAKSDDGKGRFTVTETVSILHQISVALKESIGVGVRYLAINPSEVFLSPERGNDDLIVYTTPLNLAYFLEQLKFNESIEFMPDKGPFTAPERLEASPHRPDDEMTEESTRAIDAALQFSLGMLGWTMLEGVIPFQPIPDESAFARMSRFSREAQDFSQRILKASWRSQGRALSRILEQMVRADPTERWYSMDLVEDLFAALRGSLLDAEVERRAKNAYREVSRGGQAFYDTFYRKLFERAPRLRAQFPQNDPPERQKHRIDLGLQQLLNYRQGQVEPTTLSTLRELHRSFNPTTEEWKIFGNCLIDAFEAHLPHDEKRAARLAALEVIIWPGIYYFID